MIRLPIWILWWLVQMAIKIPFAIMGLWMMRVMYYDRYTHINALPWYKKIFANPEDWRGGFKDYEGSVPTWYIEKMGGDSYRTFWRYHAIRNPADGLRNIKWLQLWIEKDKVKYWTPKYFDRYEPWADRTPGWRFYIAWQGFYAGLKLQWVREKTYSEIKLGFRVEPRDAHHELPESSVRKVLGASMASKVTWSRPV